MPGSNERVLEKAKGLAADALIFDLEDAVSPDQKDIARAQVLAAVSGGGYGNRELVVRINDLDSPWGQDDLAAAIEAAPNAILVPKVSNASDIQMVEEIMAKADAPSSIKLWVMMETPLAMLNAKDIAAEAARLGARLSCFVMGTNDLAKDTGASLGGNREGMLAWLSISVAAAKAYGIDIIDGVYNDFRDEAGFRLEAEQGARFGMDGKTLIHPGQIDIANEIFSPAQEQIDWARKIIAAFEDPKNAGKGVITVEGRMVELLHADMAKRTVAISDAITALQS
ncbi:MAG: CoA ester lyase [Rhizobiales bacterium]|nr:CoA ester lyase [Hyphomicrobiales bacterium]